MGNRQIARLGRTGAFCGLLAAAWALAQGPGDSDAGQRAVEPTANRAPAVVSNAPDGGLAVRAGERATLIVEALDPDAAADGKAEPVWLSAAFSGDAEQGLPGWQAKTAWSSGPAPGARLEIGLSPPRDAEPGRHRVVAGATDARGMTTVRTYAVTVLKPRCGPLEVLEDGACRTCAEHEAPNASGTACEPCPSGTERPAGAGSCADCAPGLVSGPGGACGCGPARIPDQGACVDCPPDTEAAASADACVACPAGTERPAGSDACGAAGSGAARAASAKSARAASSAADTTAPTVASAGYAGTEVTLAMSEPVHAEAAPAPGDFTLTVTDGGSPVAVTVTAVAVASQAAEAGDGISLTVSPALGGSAAVSLTYTANAAPARRPRDAAGNRLATQTVSVAPLRTLTAGFASLTDGAVAEDAGRVRATLTLSNPPDSGKYTGCGLRLAPGGTAAAADVEFLAANKSLKPGNGWSAADARLLRIIDDALAEGDESLIVEAHCSGGDAGMVPAASGLASEPVTLSLTDNESRAITLSVEPASLAETAAATSVTVTATLDGEATEELTLPLTLGGTATADDHSVTGTESITIAAGQRTGTTMLTVTPSADADDADETVTLSSTLAGYAVAEATLTIAEPSSVAVVASLEDADSTTLSEGAGAVSVRLALEPKPAQGTYKDCRLRLAPGSVADASDVTFPNRKRLKASNNWSAKGGLLTLVDDALAEDAETLVVEGHCGSSTDDADPPHTQLASQPLTLTITDNDAPQAIGLSVDPTSIGETLGEQTVTVSATVDAAPSSDVTVDLSLGAGSYAAAGTLSVTIAAGSTSGSTTLTFTPSDDSNATDDAVAVTGAATGHTVTGTSLTITEPVLAGGVDLSGLGVALSVSPTAVREGASGPHTVTATLTGAPVPAVDVAFTLAVGGTATDGASHDYTLSGAAGWKSMTVAANDAHLTATTPVTVAALTDAVEEGGETVTFTVSQVAWGTTVVPLATPAVATLRITEAWSAPPAPTGLSAVPTPGGERHGLDLSWDAVAAVPPVDGYVARLQEVGTAAWSALAPQPGTAAKAAGLKAGTGYEVRVLARSAAGDGPESGGAFARTADGACTVGAPSVTNAPGTRSATDLEAAWDAAACAGSVAVAGYRVRYREDPDVENVTNPWLDDTASGRTATLTALTPDTAYVVEVRAVEAGGDKGPWSAPGKARTGLDPRLPPRPAAPAVAAHAVYGDERLDAAWTRVAWTDGHDVAHPITEYQHRHRADGGDWTEATDARALASETASMTRTIAGLDAGTWHEVQARGVNRMMGVAYPGKWSEPGRGRTWGVPDQVEEPAAYLTGSAVVAVWDAPDDGGSAITDYDVQYRTSDSGGWTPHAYAGCGVGSCETTTSIPALARKVQVRAENAVGMGAWSPTARVRQLKLLRVSYPQASATVDEGTSLLVTARLDGAADRPVAVPVTTLGGAGAFRLDNAPGNAIAFGLGTSEQTFSLAALQDADGDDETVTLGFGTLPDGVLLAPPASLVATIDDDEASNGTPTFDEGVAATRTVAENTAAPGAVGTPVAATDPDQDGLNYSLAGTDAALFAIDASTGQIRVGTGTALDFEGAATSYALTVQASDGKDGDGTAEATPAVDATIAVTVKVSDESEPPSAPSAPTLDPGATTLDVKWTAPDNTGPRITDYDVFYRVAGETDWTDAAFEGTGTETTLTGLATGTTYEVHVQATNDEGTSGPSAAAEANTLPRVTLEASVAKPVIGADNAAVTVTLTGTAQAAGGGTLTGAWLEGGGGSPTVLQDGLALASGTAVTLDVASAAPGKRTYGFRVAHELDGRTSTTTEGTEIEWRPTVVLSADPEEVREADGARTVTVTATLTGTSATAAAKTVTVSVDGGTATAVTDFAAVDDFAIAIPGGTSSAAGTFTLTPVADSVNEGAETVAVTGTATDGAPLAVTGAVVTIDDGSPELTVTAPANGYVTGTTGSGASLATVIDCGSGGRTDCAEEIADGSDVTLTATADEGYGLSGWTGDCSGTGICTVTVDADKAVGAAFVALPGKPAAPSAAPADHESLTVSWSAPSADGSGITGYAVRHSVADADSWTEFDTGGTDTSATVTGLAAGTEYDLQVQAIAAEGGGAWSDSGQAVTLPEVTVTVDDALPAIPDGNAAASVTLTARATAAEGALTGRWVQKEGAALTTVTGDPFDDANGTMTSGTDYTASFSFDSPGARTYGLMVAHGSNADHGEVGGTLDIEWVPTVVLSVDKASVAEDDGTETVKVTATLTGTSVAAVAKTVTVKVAGGTATVTDDFAAVTDFTIAVPASTASASGTFDLTPVADTADELDETVAVSGTAAQGTTALPVDGTTVTIADVARHELTVTAPANGRITGSGIDCGGTQTDCAATFADNVSVTLSATPEAGYALDGWSGDCSGRGSCELTMDADKTAGATFGTARTLTVTAPANGKVTGKIGTESVIDCGTDCAETVADGTAVALKAAPASDYRLSAWGGDCATETSADCSVSMDADKAVSVTFTPAAVDGRCDESVVDGCADGTTLNTTAHADDDTHHHWRCDGLNGGANSAKCSKAKAGCTGGSQGWTVGSNSCSASVGTVTSGQTATANDRTAGLTGSATFKCDDGSWVEQSGSTCERECRTTSHSWRVGSATCSARIDTLQSGWSDLAEDETYRDTGTARYACDDGTWTGPRSASCNLGCAGQTVDGCVLTNTVHNSSSGSCASGSSGACSYSCINGEWSRNNNSCQADCDATTLNGCPLAQTAHGSTSDGSCGTGYSGTCSYTCDDGTWKAKTACNADCAGKSETWTGATAGRSCAGTTSTVAHGASSTATDDVAPDRGSATYMCSNGTWSDPTSKSCNRDCAAQTIDGCSVAAFSHGNTRSGTCGTGYSGSCSYSCGDATWTVVEACDPELKISPIPTLGYVTADDGTDDGISCGYENKTNCVEPYNPGTEVSPSATAKSGYRFTGWTGHCSGASCDLRMTEPKTVSATFQTTLEVNPGGENGNYTATHTFGTLPGGGYFSIYTANVSASATGGVSPYTFRWEDQTTDSATAIYVFVIADTYDKDVTVTDSETPNGETDEATAKIYAGTSPPGSDAGGAGGAQGASEELAPFEVPLGGELRIIWGEDSAITASSGDAAVIGVSVASPEIRVTGAGLGTADVIVQTDSGELRLPVVVK